jgi:hypothetical protein
MVDIWPRHGCALAVSAEQQAEVAAAFVQDGLALGRRAVFLGSEPQTRELERRLREEGCDLAARVRDGDLLLVPEPETARLFGSTDEEVGRRLRAAAERAVRDGYPGVFPPPGSPLPVVGHLTLRGRQPASPRQYP